MARSAENPTVMSQVEKVDAAMKVCFHRLQVLERNLKSKHLELEQREALELELQSVKELLVQQEEDLKRLRKENSKTFMIAASLMFLSFLAFGVYKMIFN